MVVSLKHILRQIQADDDRLFHGRLLRRGFQHRNLGTLMPSGGGRPPITYTATIVVGKDVSRDWLDGLGLPGLQIF